MLRIMFRPAMCFAMVRSGSVAMPCRADHLAGFCSAPRRYRFGAFYRKRLRSVALADPSHGKTRCLRAKVTCLLPGPSICLVCSRSVHTFTRRDVTSVIRGFSGYRHPRYPFITPSRRPAPRPSVTHFTSKSRAGSGKPPIPSPSIHTRACLLIEGLRSDRRRPWQGRAGRGATRRRPAGHGAAQGTARQGTPGSWLAPFIYCRAALRFVLSRDEEGK